MSYASISSITLHRVS